MPGDVLHHFSEDATIQRFEPHVPKTNPDHAPAVWAIDEAHAPLYWFLRDCPRATAWPRSDAEREVFADVFGSRTYRLHAMEERWVKPMRQTQLFRYDFAAEDFVAWPDASGQFISTAAVTPLSVTAVGDLFEAHRRAGIELRVVPDLWPTVDLMVDDRWDFSHVRLANAAPRVSGLQVEHPGDGLDRTGP